MITQGTDDRDLVIAFQRGDREAYEELYRRYHPLAERICMRLLGDREDAREAAQEAFLRVLQNLPAFNGTYRVKAWVARIATNISLDEIRSRSRKPRNGGQVDAAEGYEPHASGDHLNGTNGHDRDPLEVVEQRAECARVREVLRDLPEHHRLALVLREFEGLSHREIGRIMEMSTVQVKALIHRAKRSFAKAWDGDRRLRRGLALLIPPFLFPAKVSALVRKVLGSAEQTAAQAGSSPALATTVGVGGERVGAAMAALLVAGSVSFGSIQQHPPPTPAPQKDKVELAIGDPSPEPTAEETLKPQQAQTPTPEPTTEKREETPSTTSTPSEDSDPSPTPTEEPKPSPSPSPSPDPKPSPSPSPSPSPAADPDPGPAPAWSFDGFTTTVSSERTCKSCQNPWRSSWSSQGKAGKKVSFSETVATPIRDAEGDRAWRGWLTYTGRADGDTGSAEATFRLFTNEGQYDYEAAATLASLKLTGDGSYVYTFEGTYRTTQAATTWEQVPREGSFTLTVHFWADGTTVYRSGVALTES